MASFDLMHMIECGSSLRGLSLGASSMEEAANRIVQFLYSSLKNERGDLNCALVRCFITQPFSQLPESLAAIARDSLGGESPDLAAVPCLCLLATAGLLSDWNDRTRSASHQVSPLQNRQSIEHAPMIAGLMHEMGLDIDSLLAPHQEFLLDGGEKGFNIFYVPEALGSPFVPAQRFVRRYQIKSMLGFGGLLPSGSFFVFLLFARVSIDAHVASMFRNIALSAKLALLPFCRGAIFRGDVALETGATIAETEGERYRADATTLGQLVVGVEEVASHRTADLKLAMLQLKSATDRLTLAARASGIGIWEIKLPSLEILWDDQMRRLFGIAEEDFTTCDAAWQAVSSPAQREWVQKDIDLAMAGEKDLDIEIRLKWTDGSIHYVRSLGLLQRDGFGQPTSLIGTVSDITAERQAAQVLLESNQQLHLATMRANVLAAEADLANAAKSDFLANMSHEIRTPMNGVLGMLQVLEGSGLTPRQKHLVDVAQSSGKVLLALIDDILDLSKIEAGKLSLEMLRFDLRQLLADFAEVYHFQAASKGLNFAWTLTPDIGAFFIGDRYRLRQVLNNLCSNAIKFTDHGAVSLDVTLAPSAESSVSARFVVTDTGIGIAPERAQAIFSPFIQSDASTTRKYGGTGLGLAISKQLVEMMGGQIGVESSKGPGSSFWFTLPLAIAPHRDLEPPRLSPEPDGSQRDGELPDHPVDPPALRQRRAVIRHKVRILVAEDNRVNQLVALAQLEELGYEADAVNDGVSALQAMEHSHYGLVLMDCEMPVMDGYQATRHIRASISELIPIIAVTAHATVGEREKCLACGMNDFLSKPVDLQALEHALLKWCKDPGTATPIENRSGLGTALRFDADNLLKRLMGDRELAGIVVRGFVEDFPDQVRKLRAHVAEQDTAGARVQAHALKGASATISAGKLTAMAAEMELAAEADRLPGLVHYLPGLFEEFAALQRQLYQEAWL